jgi:hypothetical protein
MSAMGVTAQQACTDYAKSLCAKLDQCRVNGTTLAYKTVGACIAEETDSCVSAQTSNGDGNSPADTESCAVALPSASCDDYLENNLTMCPQHDGKLTNGSGCAFDSQCETGFCAVASGYACGTCAPEPVVGDECVDRGCARAQTCSPQKTCAPYVATGGTCDKATQICGPSDSCVLASGATTGVCQPLGVTAGDACDPKHETMPSCASNAGLFCNAKDTCAAITYVGAGSPCGSQSSGMAENTCTSASTCFSGTCVANAAAGESCDTSAGPSCIAGTRCVTNGNGTSGTCTTPDAAMCP